MAQGNKKAQQQSLKKKKIHKPHAAVSKKGKMFVAPKSPQSKELFKLAQVCAVPRARAIPSSDAICSPACL